MFASLKSLTKLLSSFHKISWDLYYECQVVDRYNLTFHEFYDFEKIKFDTQKLISLEIEIDVLMIINLFIKSKSWYKYSWRNYLHILLSLQVISCVIKGVWCLIQKHPNSSNHIYIVTCRRIIYCPLPWEFVSS